MAKHKGLGRGLDALLGGAAAQSRDEERLAQLPVESLRPGRYQPRTRMDQASLAELADSIRARGVIQPVVVRSVGEGYYEILAGERRWRAQNTSYASTVATIASLPLRFISSATASTAAMLSLGCPDSPVLV